MVHIPYLNSLSDEILHHFLVSLGYLQQLISISHFKLHYVNIIVYIVLHGHIHQTLP